MSARIDRRTFVALTGAALVAPRALIAQPAKRVYRIAILDDAVETARALGIAIPASLKVRADEVIE